MKKHKALKITGIIVAILLVIGIIVVIILMQMIKSIGAVNGSVADYDKRIEIWNTVPGNSSRSKLEDMNIDYDKSSLGLQTLKFIDAIVGTEYKDVEQAIDTFTYLYEIKGGHEKETYEDAPYLIPYTIPDSKGAVIVIPGGGFAYKSMDGTTGESKDIAMELNNAGYSAFVLHYRSNPYEYPIPQLDVQRAVRFIKYHEEEFGIDPDKIGLIGFSAGGNQVGTYINLIMGNDLFPEDYVMDEIDMIDDTVQAPAMIYPALTFDYNVPMLFAMFDDKDVRNESTRKELLAMMDLKQHINPNACNQFVSYGTKDGMVGMDGAIAYINSARNSGISVTEAACKDSFHCVYQKDIYTNEQWLEIMPLETSKANAIKQLKKLLGCDKVISFGDGKNDIDMFELSDECYAVQNADEELKKIATAVIGSNDEDGVAKWFEQKFRL